MQQGHHGALGQQVPTTEEQCALQLIIIFLLIFSRQMCCNLFRYFPWKNHHHHGEGDHDLDDQDDQDDHDLDSEGNWCRGQDGTPSVM